jgi:PAS domain S-box-containing protein
MASPLGKLNTTEVAVEGAVRSALAGSPDAVLILDLAGCVRFVNASAAVVFGVDPEGLAGQPASPLWTQPDRAAVQSTFEAAARGNASRFDALVDTAAPPRRLDVTVTPLRDETGAVFAILAVGRDITAIDEARLAAEARAQIAVHEASVLRSVADMAYLGTWEMDFRTGSTRVAGAGVQAMRGGPQHNQLDTEAGFKMFAPEDEARIRAMIEAACRTGTAFRYEAQIRRHDGTLGWVREFGEPILEDGACIGIRGAGMDISEEIAAREAVERAEQRLKLAAQLAGMEVFELDFDHRVLIRADASARQRRSPLPAKDLWPNPLEVVDPRDQKRVRAEWEKAVETGAPFRCEFRVEDRDGQEAWVYCVAEVFRGVDRPHRLVVATMDITARKRHELEILQTMEQMREHEMRQKLLLDELNHRVKNTLASVQSVAVQTLANAREPREARDLFIERLMALSTTHDLLVKHAWTSASFRELVEATLRPYGHAWRHVGPDLRLDPNYAVSLGMAVHELATNAIKYGAWRTGGQVEIATEVGEAEVRIVWRESGGPPVSPPARSGFGARLLQRGVAAELGGRVLMDFAPDGLVCSIAAPVSPRLRLAHEEDRGKSPLTV